MPQLYDYPQNSVRIFVSNGKCTRSLQYKQSVTHIQEEQSINVSLVFSYLSSSNQSYCENEE